MLSAPTARFLDDGGPRLAATGRTTTGTFAVIDAPADGELVLTTRYRRYSGITVPVTIGVSPREVAFQPDGSAETAGSPKLPEGVGQRQEKLDSQGARFWS